jgi:dihydrofolate reductase
LISMIVAMAQNRIIGAKNRLPWSLPADLANFRTITWGHKVVMGRKTYESIGKALPGRENIIFTRNPANLPGEGFQVATTVAEVLALAANEEIFIIGGAQVYLTFLPYADRIYLTLIEADIMGDTFFPELGENWRLVSKTNGVSDPAHPYPYSFLIFQKQAKTPAALD